MAKSLMTNCENLKPFNIDRAKAGDLFARKSDMQVPSEWHYFNTLNQKSQPLVCVFHGEISEYCYDGRYNVNGEPSPDDLVMLPKKKKLTIGIAKSANDNGHYQTTTAFNPETDPGIKVSLHMNQQFNFVEVEVEVDD